MNIRIFLLTFAFIGSGAIAADFPTTAPFAERFPPESITTKQRADEVIRAYEEEKKLLDNWKTAEDKACFRNFFVTYCRDSVREEYYEHLYAARKVWVVARDFNRKLKSSEAEKTRKEKEAKQAERNAQIEAEAAANAKARKRGVVATPTLNKPGEPLQNRVLTPEQEKANEAAYAEKQIKHEEKVAEDRAYVPEPPSPSEEERLKAREERRAAAEKKRQENIKKREAKAKEYQEQIKLREEQKAREVLKNSGK